MTDTGALTLGSFVNVDSADKAWTPSGGGGYCSPRSQVTDRLAGFTSSAGIPTGATIDGVEVTITYNDGGITPGATVAQEEVYLLSGSGTGLIGSNQKDATNLTPPSAPGTASKTWGGPTDTWGASLTPAIVNSDFGFGFACSKVSGGTYFQVISATIKIYYTTSVIHTKTATFDAALAARATKAATFDAELAGLQSKTVTLDAATAVRVVMGGGTESDDTGAVGPSSVDQNGTGLSSPATWFNLSNALALDGSYATATTVFSGGAQPTNWAAFTFPDMDIPTGAAISGIEVVDHAMHTSGGGNIYASLKIGSATKSGGTIFGDSWSLNILRSHTYGGASDLWAGTWTASDFTAPIVSIFYSAEDSDMDFSLDSLTLKVYYTVETPSGLAFDADLGKLTTKTVTLDSVLTALRTLTATIDAALATPHTKSLTADAALADMHTLATTLDAVLANHTTKSATLDVALADLRSKTVALDAALAARPTKSLTFDAALFGQGVETISLTFDAVLQALQTVTMTLDAALATPHTAVTTFDTLLAATRTLSTTLDVVLAAVETETVTFDAALADVATKDVTLDAELAATHVTPVSLDVELSALRSQTLALNVLLAATLTKSLTFDGALGTPHTKSATFDGVLVGVQTVSLVFDALLGSMAGVGPPAGVARVMRLPAGRARLVGTVPPGVARVVGRPMYGSARIHRPGGGA